MEAAIMQKNGGDAVLNPQKPWHIYLGRFLFRLPHNQSRWRHYLGFYYPIMDPAFQHNEAARLLIMKLLKYLDQNNIKGASTAICALWPTVREADHAEQVLFSFLRGLADAKAGDFDKATKRFRWANRFNHRYFLPYMLVADYDCDHRHVYPQAATNYQTGIDCIYKYPPLNDITRHFMSLAYAGLCLCHVMMHQYTEAKADILHAEQMESENAAILNAKAHLHAALRQEREARICADKFRKYNAEGYNHLKEKVELILSEKHPHFTQLPIGSPEGIAAFWQEFLVNEDKLKRLIDNDNVHQANDLMSAPLRVMDIYHDDFWGYHIRFHDNAYSLTLTGLYSRTYTPWLDAVLAACPPEIHQRWRIIRDP